MVTLAVILVVSFHGQADSFEVTRGAVRDMSIPEIKKEFRGSDEELSALVDWLAGSHTNKELSSRKTEITAIGKPLAIIKSGINDKISLNPEAADELKAIRDDIQKKQACLAAINNVANRILKGESGFSETICSGSRYERTLDISMAEPPDEEVQSPENYTFSI